MAHPLDEVSKAAEQVARNLALLPALAEHNQIEVAESYIRELTRLLNLCYWPIERNERAFNRCVVDAAATFDVGPRSFPNSHVAAIELANSFLDHLWFSLDRNGRDRFDAEIFELASRHGLDSPSPDGKNLAVRTGLDASLIRRNFRIVKHVVSTWFDDAILEATRRLPARISRERAFLRDSPPPQSYFLMADIKRETGLSSRTLNKYAKAAGVETPGRGKKNHRFSLPDVERILRQVISDSSERKLMDKCGRVLKYLNETES